jgi:hypothetical protein
MTTLVPAGPLAGTMEAIETLLSPFGPGLFTHAVYNNTEVASKQAGNFMGFLMWRKDILRWGQFQFFG